MSLEDTDFDIKTAVKKAKHMQSPELLALGIVHEIRNPLTTIKGFLQLIKPYLKEAGKEQYADVVLAEVNRANDILYEFLNAAKSQEPSIHQFSLNKIVMDMVLLYESESALRNIIMKTTLAPQDIQLSIPENPLKQVIMNLIKNAMEAVEQDGTGMILISTEIDRKFVSLHITDNGCGMTEETINRLFTPFYSTKEMGSGIGLCICKKIIEENGGMIHVKSTQEKGSTFSILFPIIQ